MKFTNNAVYRLRHDSVTVRIAGSAAVGSRVGKVVTIARWLADHAMPTVRLVDDLPQPLHVARHPVTFWHTVPTPSTAPAPTGGDLGRILRAWHTLPAPTVPIPEWNPLTGIRARLAEQDILTPGEHRLLLTECDAIDHALTRVDYRLGHGPIHGDGFIGNLIAGPAGTVLCDFDSAALGPREWDLTPVAVGRLRFRYPVDYHRELAAAYGYDILTSPHFSTLRRLRELQLVTSVLPVLPTNPGLLPQWRHRFTTFAAGDLDTTWQPYS
ncbi:aminoglycoside phosphotransferase family protein [Nocardia sp. IFM 10818]